MTELTRKWRDLLDERQNAEITFSELYARDFHHGTDGHNAKMLIAKLAEMLNGIESAGLDIVALRDGAVVAKRAHIDKQGPMP